MSDFLLAGASIHLNRQARQQNEMEQRQKEEQEYFQMLNEMKNILVNAKSWYEETVNSNESKKVKLLKLIAYHQIINENNISIEIFPEFADKEYAKNVIDDYNSVISEMSTEFSSEFQELCNLAYDYRNIELFRNYLENYEKNNSLKKLYDEIKNLKEFKEEIKVKNSTSKFVLWGVLIILFVIFAVVNLIS